MKKLITLFTFCFAGLALAQTIDFKGCIPLFEDQMYTFNKTGESSGRNIYVTTPVDGDQPCGGLGTCEFKLMWNDAETRWEFLADAGDGDFIDPFLIYFSTSGNTSANNPPNITIGGWQENTAVTNGDCGGNLTNSNAVMTGDVRTTVLAIDENDKFQISVYPNPATEFINITGINDIRSVKIIAMDGREVLEVQNSPKIDISKLVKGMYLLEIKTDKSLIQRVKIIKK